MPRLRPARALSTVALAATAIVAAPAATAHDQLVSTNPVSGSTLAAAPATLQLRFAEPALNLGNQIVVTGPDGSAAARTPTVADTLVSTPLSATTPGVYQVMWRVTSADGHPVSGTFQFTVRGSGTATAATTSSSATTTGGVAAASPSSSPTTVTGPSTPTTDEPGDNMPKLVIGGFAALAALVAAGWFVARRRVRDDAR